MTPADLRDWRKSADLSQGQLAMAIGLSLRQYQEIEAGATALRPLHRNALEHVSLKLAVERGSLDLAFPAARSLAAKYAALFEGE